jgi:hypothetical protein
MALYPPIVASSMPAFDINSNEIRIYFSLSSYNASKKDDIGSIHITVRRQSSNVNVVTNPLGIIVQSFSPNQSRTYEEIAANQYYVTISRSNLTEF